MAKRFIPITFKDNNDQDLILQFRLGPAAADLFKSISGKPLDKIGKEGFDVKEIVHLLYAGCYHSKHDLTVDKMMELVDNFELEELGNVMSSIFPETKGESEGKQ